MRRPTATETPAPAGHGGIAPTSIAVAGALQMAARLTTAVERILSSLESEPDYDVTFVVGGLNAGAAVAQIQLPRTLHHVQLELAVDSSAPVSVALFTGNLAVADAANRHKITAGPSSSGAICSSSGGTTKAREYLDGSGILTVLFTAAGTTFANVRVRSLDKTQTRAQRT